MKPLRVLVALVVCTLFAYPVVAHHPTVDILDEDIYLMIDALVADTPHGDMVFDDMGTTTEIDITARMTDLERMVDDGLLSLVSLLDGDVSLTIDFNGDQDVSLTILQTEGIGSAEKSNDSGEIVNFGDLKSEYR